MFKLLMTYLIAVMTAGGIANTEVVANEKYQAGKHYEVLANPVATSTDGTIEVREFFWYGCPHCYQMEPFVEKWLAAKPDYVELVRSPAAFNDVWEDHARAYYVMKYSGKEETMHHLFFDAVNADQRGMRKRDKILAFFANFLLLSRWLWGKTQVSGGFYRGYQGAHNKAITPEKLVLGQR